MELLSVKISLLHVSDKKHIFTSMYNWTLPNWGNIRFQQSPFSFPCVSHFKTMLLISCNGALRSQLHSGRQIMD